MNVIDYITITCNLKNGWLQITSDYMKKCNRLQLITITNYDYPMSVTGVKCFHCTHVFDLTNLKGEKRRNVRKLNNELNIVNQLVDLHFLLFVNITGNWKNRLAHTRQIIIADWLSLSESSWHVFITRRVQTLIQR